MENGNFGKEVILDLHNCNVDKFNRKDIEAYFVELCQMIDMVREDLFWWDMEENTEEEIADMEDHLVGTSAVQFIRTSNITIHTIDRMKRVYLNIFSCKDFDAEIAKNFSHKIFGGDIINFHVIDRI